MFRLGMALCALGTVVFSLAGCSPQPAEEKVAPPPATAAQPGAAKAPGDLQAGSKGLTPQ